MTAWVVVSLEDGVGIYGMRNGGGNAGGFCGGLVGNPLGVGSVVSEARASTAAGEGVEDGREPGDVELEAELTSSSCAFFHSVWRVKGIILSILHHVMVCSLLKAMSHASLKNFMKCS
jgi:hypothetical protein